jgi:GT2 family glycosyltransferase
LIMPTKVLDLELTEELSTMAVPVRCRRVFALVRLKGRPLTIIERPVHDGLIDLEDLKQTAIEQCFSLIWERWCVDELAGKAGTLGGDPLGPATVAVCTRERPEDLKRCLDRLLRFLDAGHEILVVDNAPRTDATRSLVENHSRVNYVLEPLPGLDRARNRALKEAAHPIVAFCDDDAVPDAGWLDALLKNFFDPLVLCATGMTLPLELETPAQEWFEAYGGFGKGFERKVVDCTTRNPLHVGNLGAGTNMAVRKSILQAVGPFDEALDCGTVTRSGGDHDMFARILKRGYRMVYDPEAICWHRHRRSWKELRSTIYGYGVGVYSRLAKELFMERDLGAVGLAWSWFRNEQLPQVVRSVLRRQGRKPLDLLMAELGGCFTGPFAYKRARKNLRKGV